MWQALTANSKYTTRPIVNEYCEGKLKSTPNGGLKALETNWQLYGHGLKGMTIANKGVLLYERQLFERGHVVRHEARAREFIFMARQSDEVIVSKGNR
jgi:hypothetical protein